MDILTIILIILMLYLIFSTMIHKIGEFIVFDIDEVDEMKKNLVELKFGVIIESEVDDIYDNDDIGELIAADLYEILNNGEDYLEVFYRGSEKYEDF